MKTTVINLYGGSGSGKSTLAAGLFHELKKQQYNCELVTEFVKAWAYEGKKIDWYQQLMIFSQQLTSEALLYDKVQYIVTDSPILLAGFYEKHYSFPSFVAGTLQAVLEERKARGIEDLNFYLSNTNYTTNFKTEGRYETFEQAKAINDSLFEYVSEKMNLYLLQTNNIDKIIEVIKENKNDKA